MPKNIDIHIHSVIVHEIDHKNFTQPQLSDLKSPLTPAVRSFLQKHIRSSREHKNCRTAVFLPDIPEEQPPLKEMVDAILKDRHQFIPRSQEIARHLFANLSGRTSPGDLVVCRFSERKPENVPWLALLKMDPATGFVGERRKTEGQWQIVLRKVDEVLPSGEMGLQKAAFILPDTLRKKQRYDLMVLDQQNVRHGVQEAVASFFSDGFLQCKIALNPAEMTRKFYIETKKWLEKTTLTPSWTEEDREQAKDYLHHTIQQHQVDIAQYAATVIPDADMRDDYLATMREKGIEDLVFRPDPKQRQRLTEYTEFEGDNNLWIRIRTNAIDEMMTCQTDSVTEEKVVTIRTSKWELKRGEHNPCS